MENAKKAVILVNVGTPDKPEVKSVRRFLTQFLNDRRVIDIPWLAQKILVNLIIVPFRAKNSTRLYRQLWTPEGSPILVYLNGLTEKLQKLLGENYQIFPAMRYGNPSLQKVLEEIRNKNLQEVVVFPLFPQYASSTTGTVVDYIMKKIRKWPVFPEVRFQGQFYNHPVFVKAFAERIKSYHPEEFDHVVFSYHGLPLRHLDRVHPGFSEEKCTCTREMPEHGKSCYKATCYHTTRLLAQELGLPSSAYTVAFQSRLSRKWLHPFTDETVVSLAKKGAKKLLMVSPAFVADCLETTVELGIDYAKLYKKNGGEILMVVDSLNDMDPWVQAVADLVR